MVTAATPRQLLVKVKVDAAATECCFAAVDRFVNTSSVSYQRTMLSAVALDDQWKSAVFFDVNANIYVRNVGVWLEAF